ncbi:MAG: dihydroneopterin aldolase [Bacillati bacterium ANGP1]|uniref:7,8-dihydroneopterin aldolase n=1 Tax=Candidatus Segetimicrobium genomatis TaxID=2569760 RepID=A0A537K5G4_9BACT|nr:MAG: dihydroneopterin aldolase [Terrabacteria group bacterium ANGP1]
MASGRRGGGVPMTDRIVLSEMAFYAYHGLNPDEQAAGQVFLVDVAVEANLHRAGHTDEIGDTLDYRDLYARVREAVTGERYRLLEAVAEAVAHRLLEVERVEGVTVSVRKPHVKLGGPLAYAAAEVTRRKRP